MENVLQTDRRKTLFVVCLDREGNLGAWRPLIKRHRKSLFVWVSQTDRKRPPTISAPNLPARQENAHIKHPQIRYAIKDGRFYIRTRTLRPDSSSWSPFPLFLLFSLPRSSVGAPARLLLRYGVGFSWKLEWILDFDPIDKANAPHPDAAIGWPSKTENAFDDA